MNSFTIERALNAPVDRVWGIVGNPGVSPGPGVIVSVDRPGSPDGTGMVRSVKIGPATVHEEITSVGPGPVITYRMTKGAPVHDHSSILALTEAPDGGTHVSWDVRLRPVVPGTGWATAADRDVPGEDAGLARVCRGIRGACSTSASDSLPGSLR
jgi:Polyketide cyclase / dehydrase and lipid transport